MSKSDISVILCAYGETQALAATMTSVARAVAHARAQGLSVECLMAASHLHGNLKDWAAEYVPGDWQVVDARTSLIGATRQAGIARAHGVHVATIEAGDMWSRTWLAAAHAAARAAGTEVVWHPQIVFRVGNDYFDGRPYWTQFQPDTLEDGLGMSDLLAAEPYADGGFVPRALLERVPFPCEDAARGWGHVDWWWACRVAGAGHHHRTVPRSFHYRILTSASEPFGKPAVPAGHRVGPIMSVGPEADAG
ncbi:hypothetical protein [Ancylobacter sp. TS-1]|uniref:hypothetical protein n=1 Tax=Ancylobacter sp. TS-1 TaxID=1850374 RepID=UPI001265CB00|nr:hypothetical protein [Ancylobacter sp. TS-1]QFR33492.1 hypothetical protein GBB76_10315 [Ancylobacter sp. TS-1]